MDRYDHFKDNLKVLGNNAKEMICPAIATCMSTTNSLELDEWRTPAFPTCFGPHHLEWIIGERLRDILDAVMTTVLR